jgi:hypothetical protein
MTTIPAVWMNRLCSGSLPLVLSLYDDNAVLVPTYDKSDLPGAGRGVLVGQSQIAGYLERFMSKPKLCGRVNTLLEQNPGGAVTVFSGLYTFRWQGGFARARYTFVAANGKIVTQHSSEAPT